jgi:pimeloyl-ACP methyl ester carboxylesterase
MDAVETIRSGAPMRRTIPGPTGELSYLEWPGDAAVAPVVFLQPVNTAAAIWDQVAPMLSPRGSYAIDYRGHGSSTASGPYLPPDYADDALAMMDAAGIDRAHLVGGSIGGAVAAEIATRGRSRVASIALFGGAVHLGFDAETLDAMLTGLRAHGVAGWFALHGSEIVGSAAVPGVADRLVELAGGRDVETVCEIVLSTFGIADSRPAARQLHRAGAPPALVATGMEDPTCPPEMARELAQYLNADAVLMAGIGHLPMLEAPTRTARMIETLLAGADG